MPMHNICAIVCFCSSTQFIPEDTPLQHALSTEGLFIVALQADKFHKTGRQLRSKMWWQNMKMKILVVLVILILIFVIFLIVCFSGGNCIKK